jgi:hypothetical protein
MCALMVVECVVSFIPVVIAVAISKKSLSPATSVDLIAEAGFVTTVVVVTLLVLAVAPVFVRLMAPEVAELVEGTPA